MITPTAVHDPQTTHEHGDVAALLTTVRSYLPPEDVALIERAYAYAAAAHAGKLRYSGHPYIVHPVGTAQRLANTRVSAAMIAAGLLHDVIEDADRSAEDLRREFGREIASLVEGVTKTSAVRLRGEERYIENLRKMFVAMAKDIRVIIIKFCDRLHNLETLQYVPEPKRTRIARESLEIHAPIANRLGMFEIKAQLEDLAFPYAHPEDAQWIASLITTLETPQRKHLCGELRDATERYLADAHVAVISIEARMKHRYSLYQKLLRLNRDIAKVYDHLALRVIVEQVADCYTALSVIHQHWQPLPDRLKDYIAHPKPNGYRSLHTTVAIPDSDPVEFQIRTREIHEEAEWGAAASWRYHERGTYQPPEQQLRWVEELIRWQRSVRDPKDFLMGLKYEVLRDRILVFTPKGDVIDLPEGATPLDFAYAVHSDIGNHAVGARINGGHAFAALDRSLDNGDLVEIVVDPKRAGPSPDWLSVVKTTHARAKIRDALRGNIRTRVTGWVAAALRTRRRAPPASHR
ncbi:bifunctional (p)ppGpp synthetase/guanosine-3',5'-bis(diphosphate) 3'-pyrophosphohydrolase [Candidatus Uhrbacteria bacterium]|nr:bifunctional (p)ppGpp synthetase/guanosine-3',5'-bis(diphosphate) 3'-pyrophosphohydrolase [Candidatus Uhrbacteria bacterium]